jgi:hypothetical protein
MGFEFPSIEWINLGIAIDGLSRDLNHHVPAYRLMARITLVDWTCSINGCVNPLDSMGLKRNFTHYYGRIPTAWIVAQKGMGRMPSHLSLHQTDQSFVPRCEMSITHASKICARNGRVLPHGRTWISLHVRGIQWLHQISKWCGPVFKVHQVLPFSSKRKVDQAAVNAWERMRETIQDALIVWFYTGDPDLLMERETCCLEAERKIHLFGYVTQLPPSWTMQDCTDDQASSWGSDGSMIPATANPLEHKTITAAVSGPISVAVLVTGRNNSILHGELMGLILDHVLSLSRKGPQELFSDHLNSVHIIQDARSTGGIEARLRKLPGRSYYRWIIHIQRLSPHLMLKYTPGHSREQTTPAILNSEADQHASYVQKHAHQLPIAPIPTFFMDEYTFYTPDDGWIESDIKSFINASLVKAKVQELGIGRHHRMATWLYDQRPPPGFIYTHAVAAYSAAVQLYAWSGQLATASGLCQKAMLAHDLCRLGCCMIETPHHIFVECPIFQTFRNETAKEILRVTEKALESGKKELHEYPGLRNAAESFLTDCSITWPLTLTQFYLGHIPPLERYIHRASCSSTVMHDRLLRNIHSAWHVAAVRLTGRIYGDFLQRISIKSPFAAAARKH